MTKGFLINLLLNIKFAVQKNTMCELNAKIFESCF